jgi:hypothetical protein
LSADEYLRGILAREAVDSSLASPLRTLESEVLRLVKGAVGDNVTGITTTGAFEKGTANKTGRVVDFLVSFEPLAHDPIGELYELVYASLAGKGYQPKRNAVGITIELKNVLVDIIPGRRESLKSDVHELWVSSTEHAVKTNPAQHIIDTISGGRREEIRIIKVWRDQLALDFPTFYLELSVQAALKKRPSGTLNENVWAVFGYLESLLPARSVLDPVNANNIVSDTLDAEGKEAVRKAAAYARAGRAWSEIIP